MLTTHSLKKPWTAADVFTQSIQKSHGQNATSHHIHGSWKSFEMQQAKMSGGGVAPPPSPLRIAEVFSQQHKNCNPI